MDSSHEDLDTTSCSSTSTVSEVSTLNESSVERPKNCITSFVIKVLRWASFWTSPKNKGKKQEHFRSSESVGGRSTPQASSHDDSFCESNNTHKQVLDNYLAKVNMTANQIEKYRGPHFTHEFCSLEEECIRHAVRLEAMHVPGMHDFDQARKSALHQVKSMSKKLKAKTHSQGQPCPECELQSIRLASETFIE